MALSGYGVVVANGLWWGYWRYKAIEASTTEIRRHEEIVHGEGDWVLRPDEVPHTVEREIRTKREGYRDLHADKENRLAVTKRWSGCIPAQ